MLELRDAIEPHGSIETGDSPRRPFRHPALEQLVCAAVSNAQLADTLLREPALALRKYEVGRNLSTFEQRIVLSVADSIDIYEFAGRLHAMLRQAHDSRREAQSVELTRERRAAPAAAALLAR